MHRVLLIIFKMVCSGFANYAFQKIFINLRKCALIIKIERRRGRENDN